MLYHINRQKNPRSEALFKPGAAAAAEMAGRAKHRPGDPDAAPPTGVAIEIRFLCRECATKLVVSARWQGLRLNCPRCGAQAAVPACSESLRASHPPEKPPAGALVSPVAPQLTSDEIEFLTSQAG